MDKILNYLGLSRRSKNLVAGTDQVISALQKNASYLIFIASDASIKTKDKIVKKAYFYNIPVIDCYNNISLNMATGLKNAMVLAITDKGLAQAILNLNLNEKR